MASPYKAICHTSDEAGHSLEVAMTDFRRDVENCFPKPARSLKHHDSGISVGSSGEDSSPDEPEVTDIPKELASVDCLYDMDVKLGLYRFLPAGEVIYILPDGGPVIFLKGDRPQEFFGTEACLVRNHRFDGFYFIRTNGIITADVMAVAAARFASRCSLNELNRNYLKNREFNKERVVGATCGLYVDLLQMPLQVTLSLTSVEMYQKATLVFLSPPSQALLAAFGRGDPTSQHYAGHSGERAIEDNDNQKMVSYRPPNDAPRGPRLCSQNVPLAPQGTFMVYECNRVVSQAAVGPEPEAMAPRTESGGSHLNAKAPEHIDFPHPVSRDTDHRFDSGATNGFRSRTSSPEPDTRPRHNNRRTNQLYKTELCRNFTEVGLCRYGDSCQYAHGSDELRAIKRHSHWKTKTCLAWLHGGCTYGHRCCYAHEIIIDNPKVRRGETTSDTPEPVLAGPVSTMTPEIRPAGISRFARFFSKMGDNVSSN